MICPDCGIKIDTLPCERCESEAAWHEKTMQELVEKHSLIRGAPDSDEARESLDFALARLQQRFDEEESSEGTIPYDVRDLLRHPRWWHIPIKWIGCKGFIVSLDNGYVNCLGSATSLDDCFWGHERGLFCDTVDFSFAPDTDLKLAGKLLRRFQKEPDSHDESGADFVWYGRREIEHALAANFPNFRRHFVWFALPELRAACEHQGLEFRCELSASREQC